MTPTTEEPVIIIIGAGIVGLTLAHGLKRAGIPFQIFERDESAKLRSQGWALTLHWALPFLRELLGPETLSAVDDSQVDAALARHDHGNFLFLNLETLDVKFRIPPGERRRLDRNKLREALVEGLEEHINWGKRLVNVQTSPASSPDGHDSVTALFADGSEAQGRLLLGVDGSSSAVRRFLIPEKHENHPLPVHMLGTAVEMTPAEAQPLRDIDPLLFQGCHPETGVFLWVSTLSTPETNGTVGTNREHYLFQLIISWMVKDGDDSPIPTSNTDMVSLMKRLASSFHPVLRTAVDRITDSHPISNIAIRDWPCHSWDNRNGAVTLLGDAAHAMTMYRGEACNHGILDARNLLRQLQAVYGSASSDGTRRTRKEAIDTFEEEMRTRTAPAVLLSREACLGAHDFHGLNENSAVLKRRTFTL